MKRRKLIGRIFLCIFSFLGFLAFFSAKWYVDKYGDTGFMSIISTFASPWTGCANSLKESWLFYGLLPTVLATALTCFVLFFRPKRSFTWKKTQIYPIKSGVATLISLVLSVAMLSIAAAMVHFPTFVYNTFFTSSTIYEEEYVAPGDVSITFPEQKRNLVYIYLESMETSFFSTELGGGSEENLIPELYALAEENTSFSHNEGIGGWPRITHTTWTSAAMVAQTAGVPLTIDISQIDLSDFQGYLPGATTLNDVLHEAGYYQTLMVGSDASFGGRKEYFEQHGVDHVYDLATARQDGLIPEDYMVWWGYEDAKLFDYAKQELSEISKQEQPFAFTLLTVDTHHIDGYSCELCQNEHGEQYENVLSCSSRQVASFVEWLKTQDFYENTTVIICGDHPSMDNQYFVRNIDEDYERHVYNCFINAPLTAQNTKNRLFTPMDLFPTTLAALGCDIEGDRLALGTNLFSDLPTLAERIGLEELNNELAKHSELYDNVLIPEKTGEEAMQDNG